MYDEPPMDEPHGAVGSYDNFDENMADPFGSKKAVQNTPPGGGGMKQASIGGGQAAANFHNELSDNAGQV